MRELISRQAAIDALRVAYWDDNIQSAKDDPCIVDAMTDWAIRQVKALPPAQPEIIYCKDCVKHNKGLGNYEVHPDGSTTWIWKDSACPLVSWRDKAQGHEFDYQFCAYAEKREVTEC